VIRTVLCVERDQLLFLYLSEQKQVWVIISPGNTIIIYHHCDTKQAVTLMAVTLLARRMLPHGELRCMCECYRRRQMPATVTSLAPYTLCRRAGNKVTNTIIMQPICICAQKTSPISA